MCSKIMCTLTWDNIDVSVDNSRIAWGLLTQMSPAGPITNILTPLWSLPFWLNPWKKAEFKRRDEQRAWWQANYASTREKLQRNQQRPCWSSHYLENAKTSGLTSDFEAACCLGMLAHVGVFTIGGPLNYFLMAMVLHQEWLAKVQQELDRVCGDRLPTLDDYPNLPVLRACIKETMRWRPNVPTGVAHEVEADDYYRGYFIEKGTRILPLDW
jgi:cytochrome P450